jgi:23S rRNA (cytosine1962-C5)-methyltransferase
VFGLPAACERYRDGALIAVDKPAGVPCQAPDASQPDDLPRLLRRLLAGERGLGEGDIYLGTHQRLDQDTSGIILYSLDRAANASLAEQFAGRQVEKLYVAAISGRAPAKGAVLEHWLAPDQGGRMRVAQPRTPGAKLARTLVIEVEARGERSLLTLRIETGRTHQIRAQLAAVGCPVVGDRWYGGTPALRLMLHASRLALRHPTTGEPLVLEAPAPLEFAAADGGVLDHPRLLARALELAAMRRVSLWRAYESGETTAFRWVNGLGDGIPDVYIDVYDRWLAVRVDGDERDADEVSLAAALSTLGFAGAQIKRHPRQANELLDATGARARAAPDEPLFGGPAPESFLVHERGMPFEIRLRDGLRSGLFLDQRDNRAWLREVCRGTRVLNLFGYTGSFSVAALVGGASHVTTVDLSRAALAWADRNVERIGASDRHRSIAQDAFVALRDLAASGERFDRIVLDPPSYSTSKRGRFRAIKDYPALCAAALAVLADDGLLLASVNHHGISREQLRSHVRAAARIANRSILSIRDRPTQRDFPLEPGAEPAMKSVLVECSRSPRMRSPSASMNRRKLLR